MKRVALAAGMLLLAMGLAVPAISAQNSGRTWPGRSHGAVHLRPISGAPQSKVWPKASSPAAQRYRNQGYLVPDQAGYDRAKATANARAGQRQAAAAPRSAGPRIKPLIASGDPDIGPAWNGVQDPNLAPPDTTGAIGTSRYIELINEQYGIYDRNGGLISTGDLPTFSGSNTPVVTDPQVIWDPATRRFYFVALEFSHFNNPGDPNSNPDNRLYLGFSRTSSPSNATTDWCKYIFSYNFAPGFDFLPDYPKMGQSTAFWMIGSNLFNSDPFDPGFGQYVGSDVAWISKPPAGSTCPSEKSFVAGDLPGPLLLDDGTTQAFTPVPARQTDPSGSGYVVAAPYVGPPGGGTATFIDTYAVTRNPDGTANFAAPVRHDVTSYSMPPVAPQSGTAKVLDTLDGRLTQAVSGIDPSKGKLALWTQHTVAGGAGSEADWYELDPTANAAIRSGQLTDGSLYVFNAAISPDRMVNGATKLFGDAFVIGFNTSSASDFVRIQMVSQWADNSMSEFVQVRASPGYNDDFTCNLVCRWGDYAEATPDPAANPFSNHGRVWLSNQWNVASENPDPNGNVDWRTYNWATNPVPFVVLSAPSTLYQKSVNFTVTWNLGNQASSADVQYRQAPWNGSFGGENLWQLQVPGGSATFFGSVGNTYCFSAQSNDDVAGPGVRNWGFGPERCAVVPLDDRALGGSGWSRLIGKGFFLNTFSQTTLLGKALSKGGVHAKNIQVMVERCPTCGSIKIYWNNVLKHTYSLFAKSTQKLVYLSAASFGSVQIGTLKIVVSSSGKPVIIDAVAVSAV